MIKKLRYLGILLIIGLFVYLIFSDRNNGRKFEFTYNVELEASNSRVEVWIPVPPSNEVQHIESMILNHKGMNCSLLIEQNHQNEYYYCTANKLIKPVNLTLICLIRRKEHGTTQYNNVFPQNYGKGTNNRTVPEGALFQDIITEQNLNKNNVRNIYDYVLSGMHYGKPKSTTEEDFYYSGKNPKTGELWLPSDEVFGRKQVSKDDVVNVYIKSENNKTDYTFGNGNSIYACNIGVGNCTDYHSYFISLCRTLNIPSRFHMGFSIPDKENESEGKIEGYHCWSDYYIDGEGWTPVDISEADKDTSKIDYFFGTLDKNRIEFTVGRDFNLRNLEESVNFFVLPIVKGTSFTKSFTYKNL